MGEAYRARAIYPFAEDMPWQLTSGEDITIVAAGDSATVYELEPGVPTVTTALSPAPLPDAKATMGDKTFRFEIEVPDEEFKRYDLYLQSAVTADTAITINGDIVTKHRVNTGGRWTAGLYDLRRWRGKTLAIEGQLIGLPSANTVGKRVTMDAWIIADRKVDAPDHDNRDLPFLISQQYRRITQHVLKDAAIIVATSADDTPLAQKLSKAKP
jgi:hypothetical protein